MKTIKITTIILLLTLILNFAFSQDANVLKTDSIFNHVQELILPLVDVNGLILNGKSIYSKKQVIAKLGSPDSYREDELGMTFYYGHRSRFYFSFDGVGGEFVINDPGFATFTSEIEGGLKVGDNISKVEKLNMPIDKDTPNEYHIPFSDWAEFLVIYDKNNTITSIQFTIYN